MPSASRRFALKLLGLGTSLVSYLKPAVAQNSTEQSVVDRWSNTNDRVWLGESFWANPMEDWCVVSGKAEATTDAGNRSIHLITHQLVNTSSDFSMSVDVEQVERNGKDGGAGFRIGVHSEINEYRSNCFAKNGINAGVVDGTLTLGQKTKRLDEVDLKDTRLRLTGRSAGGSYALTLSVLRAGGESNASIDLSVPNERVLGNVALVSNFDASVKKGKGTRYAFRNWSVSGGAIQERPEQTFGPILWSMYSLSDSRSTDGFVLKLSALTGPLGEDDNKSVELHTKVDGQWKLHSTAELDTDAWVATFRVSNWDERQETPYKLIYRENAKDQSTLVSDWEGIVKANPSGRPLRLGALTCQNDYGFPYAPVAENLVKLDPDMLYFSGDQLYESHGGFGIIRDPAPRAILNYLRKFYQFGWAFREAMRDRPTLCIPDDHDVFQGNIWGEGGMKMKDLAKGASSKGGYREPARMVNVVHRTNTAHHPDPFDPNPSEQDISVYYGEVLYGGVGFAILGDRQWKSGPERVDTGSGRADHVMDQNFDCSKLDDPKLVLLGERQESFLRKWGADWRGHTMKVLLSQTVFAGVATHHGRYDGYLKADLDSGGWPQTARNRAVSIIRESQALHINGDQHLASLAQYGVDKQRDSNWSFCTPAIAAGYPRWWRADEMNMPHTNRPSHDLDHTGEYRDGLGNLVYVYAVGNPEVSRVKNRYEKAHQKGSGFGVVTIDTEKKTYHLEAFKFLVDATDGKTSNQFPGWPVTIHQSENKGENRIS